MACNIETILQIKMIGHILETLVEVDFPPLYFLYHTYMNFIHLKNAYGQHQIVTMTSADTQGVDLLFLDIHGGTL